LFESSKNSRSDVGEIVAYMEVEIKGGKVKFLVDKSFLN